MLYKKIKNLCCFLIMGCIVVAGNAYGYTMSDIKNGITVQTDSQVAISLNYRVNASDEGCGSCMNLLIVGFGTENLSCIKNTATPNMASIMNWTVKAPASPGVYDIWVANRATDSSGSCNGITYANLTSDEKKVVGSAKLTVTPPACASINYNNDPATNWKSTSETSADGNANWDSVIPAMSGPATSVTGRCRPGWTGSPKRNCTVSQGATGLVSTWGTVSGTCKLMTCNSTNGYDDGSYDCDWNSATVYHADYDSCSYKPTLEPTRHHNRALCCTVSGWWGPYPDAESPAGSSDCTSWKEQGKQPYKL